MSSDGGVVLLREVDRRLGLSARVSARLDDARDPRRCQYSLKELIRRRVYALALGYEDLNDHDVLRTDAAIQTALERIDPLASSSTLCRLENRAGRDAARAIHEVLVERFICDSRHLT